MRNFLFFTFIFATLVLTGILGQIKWNENNSPRQILPRFREVLAVRLNVDTKLTSRYTSQDIEVESFSYKKGVREQYSFQAIVKLPRKSLRFDTLHPPQQINPVGHVRYRIEGGTLTARRPLFNTRLTLPEISIDKFEFVAAINHDDNLRFSNSTSFGKVWNILGRGSENDLFDAFMIFNTQENLTFGRNDRFLLEILCIARMKRLSGDIDNAAAILSRNQYVNPDKQWDQCLEEELDVLIPLIAEHDPTDDRLAQLKFLKNEISKRTRNGP